MLFRSQQSKSNANCSVYIGSYGSQGDKTSGQVRINESSLSFSRLGIPVEIRASSDFIFSEIETRIREIILNNNVDCLLVHDPNDSHQEHRIIYDICLSAIRRTNTNLIRYKSVSSTPNFIPNFIVDITDFFPVKLSTLENHASQNDKPYMDETTIQSFHTIFQPQTAPRKVYFEQYFIERMFG